MVNSNNKTTTKLSFWQTVKDAFKPTAGKKVFPWLQSGLLLIGFAVGVLVTSGVQMLPEILSSEQEEVEPASEADKCRERGGRYDEANENCILVTSDRGGECTDNDDCEGWCLVDDSAQIGSEASGTCSENYSVEGCVKFADNGKVNEICMP